MRALSSYNQTEAFTVAADRRQAMQREFRYQPDQLLPRVRSATWADVQRFGTETVGKLFGPVITLWFLVLALMVALCFAVQARGRRGRSA